jgi:hypothetical protein
MRSLLRVRLGRDQLLLNIICLQQITTSLKPPASLQINVDKKRENAKDAQQAKYAKVEDQDSSRVSFQFASFAFSASDLDNC